MKYQEIEEQLRDMLASGEGISADRRFLSEREISERFSVSRTTARKAIDNLCKQGLLMQVHGSGTFVKDRRHTQPLDSITRCSQYCTEMGLHPDNRLLEHKVLPASGSVAAALRIPPGDPVLCVKKLFTADRYIFNLSVSYIALSRFPGIQRMDFARTPMLEIFRARYHAYVRRTEHTLEAILPPQDVAEQLHITARTPVLLFESVSSGVMEGSILPLEYFKTYCRTDFIRFGYAQEHEGVDG